jgi:anti-anti-sigma factor
MQLATFQRNDGTTILKLSGLMDIEGTEQVNLKLNVTTAEDHALLIADLTNVDFMSSIGIGVLVRVANNARRRGGNLVLFNPRPIVRLVLEKTHIHEIITICDTMEEAAEAVREVARKSSSR